MDNFVDINEKFTPTDHYLQFTCLGKPYVQKRAKMSYRNKKQPVYYDPSNKDKKIWKNNFQSSLLLAGVKQVPIFGSNPLQDKGIILEIDFFIPRPAVDYCIKKGTKKLKLTTHLYPSLKDIDNMIKFYMDAMQDVAYANDNVIEKLICCKHFSDESTTTCIGPHIVVKIQQPLSLHEVTYDKPL